MPAYASADDVRRTAAALLNTGSVLVFRAPDGRMAAVANGLTGYGPDREAALRALAHQVVLAEADPTGFEPVSSGLR
jgi:hypothetical protein